MYQMTQQSISFSDNINAFNGFMTTMSNVMNKTKNISYNSTNNLTTISGIVNVEALGVLGQPVALKSELNNKADATHNHNGTYAAINHNHLTSDISQQYEEEETNNEEETITITKTRTLDSVFDSKANISHTHTLNDITYYTAPDLSSYATTSAMNTALSGKSDTSHNHDGTYAVVNHTHELDDIVMTYEEEETFEEETLNEEEQIVIETKTRTITKTKALNDLLEGKADSSHNHDGAYAVVNHTHTLSEITNSQHLI